MLRKRFLRTTGVLHLVDHYGGRVLRQDSGRVVLGQGRVAWQFERDKTIVRKKPVKERSFASLARARQYDDRSIPRGFLNRRGKIAIHPH
jgi:hypothetical protein